MRAAVHHVAADSIAGAAVIQIQSRPRPYQVVDIVVLNNQAVAPRHQINGATVVAVTHNVINMIACDTSSLGSRRIIVKLQRSSAPALANAAVRKIIYGVV